MNFPLVSIMMPVYNGLPLIKASVRSILQQTYPNWECIIIDDGSSDGTSDFLDTITDERFIIVHQENGGRPVARQKALDLAKGEYIAMLDAEDLYSHDKLEKQLRCLQDNPDVVLVSSQMCSFGTKTPILRKRGGGKFAKVVYDGTFFPNHAACMIRADVAKKFRYNSMMKLGEDQDFLRRLLVGRTYIELPEIQYYYSEFDSVTKKKIRNTYKFNIKKFYAQKAYLSLLNMVAKYVYSVIVYPFVPIDSILAKRGIALTSSEIKDYEKDCLTIVNEVL